MNVVEEEEGSPAGAYDTPEDQADAAPLDDGAPRYPIPHRKLAAVEVLAVVKDPDRMVKAFGRVPSLNHVSVHGPR